MQTKLGVVDTACAEWIRYPGQVGLVKGWTIEVGYQKPSITDFGSIGGYTFDNPGKGDKGTCGKDPMFDEPSCPS